MKYLKPLIFTFVLLFAVSTNSVAQQHLKFMGIPLTGTIDNFQKKLASKGIYKDKSSSAMLPVGVRAYSGYFTGKKCKIYVYYINNSKTVYRAKAVYSDENEDFADNYFSEIKAMLQSKYSLEQSESDNTSYNYPVYRTYVTDDYGKYLGEIDLFKDKFEDYGYVSYSIHVDYIDGINYSKQQNSNMNDL